MNFNILNRSNIYLLIDCKNFLPYIHKFNKNVFYVKNTLFEMKNETFI